MAADTRSSARAFVRSLNILLKFARLYEFGHVRTMAQFETAWKERDAGIAMPFATIHRGLGRPVGSTRYGNLDRVNHRVEIGWTWIGRSWQRTAVNTEAKFLMLRHAFEELGCIRVELKTDSLNERSRNAILRLGAKEEGIFRNHMITSSGRLRHSVYYSILDSEWPAVKKRLQEKLSPPAKVSAS